MNRFSFPFIAKKANYDFEKAENPDVKNLIK